MQGALVYGCSVAEYFAMPAERIAQAQVDINEMFDGIPDGVAGFPHVIEDVTGFGVELHQHYQNSTPAIDRMLINDFTEIESLSCPNPLDSRQLKKTIETISQLQSKIGSEKVVIGACIAPFSLPSMLMGTSKWMRLLFTKSLRERYFKRLMDICQEFVVKWANEQFAAGAHVVVLADGMASATLIPRDTFEAYALPVIRSTVGQLKGLVGYEAVGRAEPHIDLLADVGAVALLLGEEDDLEQCKRAAQGRVGLVGNVNNMKMRRWSPARIELAAKKALKQAMDGYGFILGNQGPEIPFDTSIENIRALLQPVEQYGYYKQGASSASTRGALVLQ